MSDKKTTTNRRKLLKSIAVSSGAVVAGKTLPESWTKPVINSIMLPAHAELTIGSESSTMSTIDNNPVKTDDPDKPVTDYTITCTYTPFDGFDYHTVSGQFRHLITPDPTEDLTIRRTVYCDGALITSYPIDDYVKSAATDGKVITVISGPKTLGCNVGSTITVRIEIVETGATGDCDATVVFDYN